MPESQSTPLTELRACPVCKEMLDINYAMYHLGWRMSCTKCHTHLTVQQENVGEESCVWFEVDDLR